MLFYSPVISLAPMGVLRKYLLLVGLTLVGIMILHTAQKKNLFKKSGTAIYNVSHAEQDDPNLIRFLRTKLVRGSSSGDPNLSRPEIEDASQADQAKTLNDYLKNKTGGTFIEAGALGGKHFSKTLILEKKFGWTGLLVESDPMSFQKIMTKRNAYSINCCISPDTVPKNEDEFSKRSLGGRIVNTFTKHLGMDTPSTCFPIYSLMLAMNLTSLDFLSLSLEGIEVKVLQTLPWEKIDIKAMLIEIVLIPEGTEFLRKFMETKDYKLEIGIGDGYFFSKIN